MEQKTDKLPLSDTCPLCKKKLELMQINFKQALFICPDINCRYPVGDFECVLVERPAKHINKPVEFPKELNNAKGTVASNTNEAAVFTDLEMDLEKLLNSTLNQQNISNQNVNTNINLFSTLPSNTDNTENSDIDDFLLDLLK